LHRKNKIDILIGSSFIGLQGTKQQQTHLDTSTKYLNSTQT